MSKEWDDWDDESVVCDHAEYEVDWEGSATCVYCHERRWLTTEQLEAHHEAEARYMEAYDRMQRREQNLFWRTIDWLRSIPHRIRRRIKPVAADIDDIPF